MKAYICDLSSVGYITSLSLCLIIRIGNAMNVSALDCNKLFQNAQHVPEVTLPTVCKKQTSVCGVT